jgi:RNA polymerase subunit RPABC4/transcription elongation factor Spt4
MALKPCKECGKEISTEAKVCPNCGKKDPTSQPVPKWLWIALGVLVLIVAVNLGGPKSTPEPPKTAAELAREDSANAANLKQQKINDQLFVARTICQTAAMQLLKAPATAEFADDAYEKDLGKGRSHIQLQVDAENSFGAKLRNTIDCKTKVVDGSVKLTSINSWSR